MENRVVVTGLGVVSPIANNVIDFLTALETGVSGIKFFNDLQELDLRCCVGAAPDLSQDKIDQFTDQYNLVKLRSSGILYGCMAGIEAWTNSGLPTIPKDEDAPDWAAGCIFGTSGNGLEPIEVAIRLINKGEVRKLGGRLAQQAMNSGVSAYLGGILGLGNQVMTNSSSYCTGSEAIVDAYDRIRFGFADRMLAGGSESSSKYIWAGYDGMHGIEGGYALASGFNDNPELASRPLSRHASGIVPGAGAGALVLESLDSARDRGARIYAEILGGFSNSGGQRQGGDMIRPNRSGIERCISKTIEQSGIHPDEIDLISGNLVSNETDILEVESWAKALGRRGNSFPWINSVKSMTGHCFSGAGAIEAVAVVLQLENRFVHPSLNSSELHPAVEAIIDASRVPQKIEKVSGLETAATLSIGMGDVNSCLLFRKWRN